MNLIMNAFELFSGVVKMLLGLALGLIAGALVAVALSTVINSAIVAFAIVMVTIVAVAAYTTVKMLGI